MSLFNRFASGCAVALAMVMVGCSGDSKKSTSSTDVPKGEEAKQKAASQEVDKSKEKMKEVMEKGGLAVPEGTELPQFNIPKAPPGVKTGGGAPSAPKAEGEKKDQ